MLSKIRRLFRDDFLAFRKDIESVAKELAVEEVETDFGEVAEGFTLGIRFKGKAVCTAIFAGEFEENVSKVRRSHYILKMNGKLIAEGNKDLILARVKEELEQRGASFEKVS